MEQKRKRGDVNVILPGKLYQRGNFLKWTHSQKKALLERYKITMVVNLWCKVDPDLSADEVDRIYLNWHCSPSHVPKNADLLVDFVTACIRGGYVVLIHCEAGRGRSVWLSGRVVSEILQLGGKQTYALIEKAVPNHDLTSTLQSDLMHL